jgi:hypothetical protein
MNKLFASVALSLFAAVASSAAVTEFYVSPSGSDSNKGTKDAPFKTILKARNAVRDVNQNMTGDIVVYLRDGTYPLSNTVTFDNRDGGTNGFKVRYENYGSEQPFITGGVPIEGWTLYDEQNNIWCAKGVSARFRQLYVGGKKAIRARYPNLESDGSHNFFRLTKVDSTGRAFDVSSSYTADWKNMNKVEMHLMIAWADAVLRIEKIEKNGTTSKVIPQDPERSKLFRRKYPMLGTAFMSNPPKQQCFYFENAYEFIDQPGEWYLDESADILYYKPRTGESLTGSVVVAPNIGTLFEIKGESTKNKVQDLTFKGLIFAHSNYLRPGKEGFLDLQAGQFNVDVLAENGNLGSNKFLLWRPDAGVTVTNASRIVFERNVFTQMAATGLDFVSGTNDDRIVGNVFTDIGGSGISIGKFAPDSATEIHGGYNPSDKDEICTRDTIKNNLVTHGTTEIQGGVGIVAGYPRYIVIEHNEVGYMNYTGISVGFGWTKSTTAMTNNKINWNKIHNIAQLLSDGGAIYTLSNQGTGSEIQYNYSYDISASKWSDYWTCPIYLDEGSSGFTVAHNVAVNAPSGTACNQCGSNTTTDNDGKNADVIAKAGIESAYADIADIKIPVPDFSEMTPQAPYKGAISIPGLLQVEDYDEGGERNSYYDEDSENQGGTYREDAVDIVATDGGYAVGYTIAGEWLEYTVNVEKDGSVDFKANAAAGLDGASFRLFLDDQPVTDTVKVPNGGDWETYSEVAGTATGLVKGEHILKLLITGGYVNLDYIQFGDKTTSIYAFKSLNAGSGTYKVFDLRGEYVGTVNLSADFTAADIARQVKLKKGVYLVKNAGGLSKRLIYSE